MRPFLIHFDGDRVACLGVAPKGRQPVAKTAFGGKDAIHEAKQAGIMDKVWLFQILEQVASAPVVDDPPADQEEHGNGIEGDVSLGRSPAKTLGQHVAQRAEVDQAEQKIEFG